MAGIDGMRFVVPVRSIHARPNPKYFGRRRGATWLNMLNDQAVGLAGRVLSGTPRDSLHMIDLIYSQDAGQRPDVIITDTRSTATSSSPRSRCSASTTARSSPTCPTRSCGASPSARTTGR